MKHHKSIPLFVKLFIAFVLIMVIPVVVVSTIYYYYMLSFFREELINSGTEKLYMAQGVVQASLDEIQNDAKQIALNNAIESLSRLSLGSSDTGTIISAASNVLNLLYNTKISNENIQSNYLYDYNSEVIYTSDMLIFNRDDFYDTGWIEEYKNRKKNILWLETRDTGIPVTRESSAKSGLAGTYRVITMVYPLTYTSSFQGLLVINIKEDELGKVLDQGVLKSNGEITVISPDGHVVLSSVKGLVTADISDREYISQILSSG